MNRLCKADNDVCPLCDEPIRPRQRIDQVHIIGTYPDVHERCAEHHYKRLEAQERLAMRRARRARVLSSSASS